MKRWGILIMVAVILAVATLALWVSLKPLPSSLATTESVPNLDLSPPTLVPGSAGQLSAWVFNGSIPAAAWERIAEGFQKSSGFGVKLTIFESESKYREALRHAMAEHTLPDVFLIESIEAEAFRQAGHLEGMDLEPADSSEWLPAGLACFQREKKTLAFPSDFTLLALYYNTAAFDRVGVAYPGDHWNWSVLVSMSQAIYRPATAEGREPFYAIELPIGFDLWEALSLQAGGGLYQNSAWLAGDPKQAGPQVKALTFLRNFVRQYVIVRRPLTAPLGQAFLEGRAGMVIAGTELLPALRQQKNVQWAVTPLPRDEKRGTVIEARGWAVSSLTSQPQGAARLARALASQVSRTDRLPAALSGQRGLSEKEQAFYTAAVEAQPPPAMVTIPEMKHLLNEEMLRWINLSNPSPEAMLDEARKLFPR